MDDLAANVTSLLGVQEECIGQEVPQLSLASNLHPRLFADLYKKKRLSHSSQEERRRTILNEQKKKRQSLIESNRSQSIENVEHHEKKQSPSKPIYKISEKFSNRLMYSEWLEEVPSDFDSNWIMVMCPVGKRCLVVASEGTTTVYNKAGKTIAKHSSILPGGSRESKSDETILDCVYNDYLRTYFVLDCLCWKSHPIIDSETEFRFFWLRCKLDELPALNQWSHSNPYAFKDVSRTFPLNSLSIREQLERINEPKIDGVLFYHKETHYTSGSTPLVGWLKTYMLPEILGVPVPQKIAESTPSDYLNAKQAISIDKSRSSTSTTSSIADYRNSADEDTMSDDTDGGFIASN